MSEAARESDLTTRDGVLDACRAEGFALAGVAPAEPTAYEAALRAWLDQGKHGEMGYLAEHADLLIDPGAMVPGARSIICVADRYANGRRDRPLSGDRPQGRIARYARGHDYHKVIRRRLHRLADRLREAHPDEVFRCCVDTAPVLEREHAMRAGLGSIGKHTLLIERGVGSYLLLGEIITTLAVDVSRPASPDPCGSCTACIDACPTDAITPWSVDATRCLSYLTIEHRSLTDERWFEPTGEWLFGCDICQEVCPHARSTRRTRRAAVHEAYAERRDGFDLLEVLAWSEDDRRAAFTTSSLKRARLDMMKRNALIVLGNHMAAGRFGEARAVIERLASDADESSLVRETAAIVLRRLDEDQIG